MFEDDSNDNNYCDSLISESDHGLKVHNNSEGREGGRGSFPTATREGFAQWTKLSMEACC